MRFMLQYPDSHGSERDMLESGSVAGIAVALEKAGWHGLAFTEHPAPGSRWLHAGGHQSLDPFVALGGAATVTRELRLLTYLAVIPYRNPLLLAKAAATVDRLSEGRFILGAGAGYLKGEFRALGVDFDERNALFDEALDALALSWRGEPFSYESRHWNARDIQTLPRPVAGTIPVWLGGNAKVTLRRVAKHCQGWMPLFGAEELFATTRTPHPGTLEDVAGKIEALRKEASGRGAELDLVLPYHDASIAKPESEADRHRASFGAFEDAGATWCVIQPPAGPEEEVRAFIESFGATYLG